MPSKIWERQQYQPDFVHAKSKIINIVQESREVKTKDQNIKKEHSLKKPKEQLTDSKRFSTEAINADYKMLENQIHRFRAKLEKGLFLKPAKLHSDSKYKTIIAVAHEHIKLVQARFKKRQIALGLDENL